MAGEARLATTVAPPSPETRKHALRETDQVRDARCASAQEHDDALANDKPRRAQNDAAKAPHLSAWHSETHRVRRGAAWRLEPRLGLQGHQGLDLATAVGELTFDSHHSPARDQMGVGGQLTELRRHDDGRAQRARREHTHQSEQASILY